MILNFSVQNFGSIKDKQTLSFEADKSIDLEDYYIVECNGYRLLKLALIYGANASGKTTLLKALEFLRLLVLDPAESKKTILDFEPFLFDEKIEGQNTLLSIEFIQHGIRYFYEVEFNKLAIVREELDYYHPHKAAVFKRTTDVNKQLSEINFGNKIAVNKIALQTLTANTLWNTPVLGGFLKTNIEIKELKDVTDWFSYYLYPIVTPKTNLAHDITSKIDTSEVDKSMVLQVLKNADFNISDILIKKNENGLSEGFIQRLKNNNAISNDDIARLKKQDAINFINIEFQHTVQNDVKNLPFEDESEGTQRYYGFAGLLSFLINKSVAFSIDELESSLHPDLFTHFLLTFLLNSRQSQLIATTHNREILNNKDIFRNDAIWITDKNDSCATELYSLSDFDSSVIRKTTNIYNSFKSGKLGGIPNLGDVYITQ